MWPHSHPSLHLQAATVGSTFPNVSGAPVPIPMIPGTQFPMHGHTPISQAQAQAANPMANLMPNPALFMAGVPPPFGGNAAAAVVASMAAAAAAASKEDSASAAAANGEAEEVQSEEVKKNTLEVSHDGRYNLNHMMQDNILKSDYFKLLYDYKTFHEVLEEIIREVKHLEPHTRGHNRTPSTAFCLLYKFFVMKLTLRQVRSLISNEKHPYVRGIGCLYLRFIAPAKSLWGWFEDLLDDDTEFVPSNDGVTKMLFGKWLEQLILEQKYYTTLFPRIPVPVMREYKKKFLLREMAQKRDIEHEKYRRSFTEGLRVEALFHEDNKWYKSQIDKLLPNGKYLVTFHGYTQKEVCSIGQLRPSAETKLSVPSSSSDKKRGGSGERDRRSASKAAASRGSSSKRRRSRSRSRSRKRESKRSRRTSRSSSAKRSRSGSSSPSRSRSRSSRRSSRHSRSHRSSRSSKSKSSHRSSKRSRRSSRSRSRSGDRSSRRRRHRSRSRDRKKKSRGSRDRSRSRSRDRKKKSRSSRDRSRSGSRSRDRKKSRGGGRSSKRSGSRSPSRSRRRRRSKSRSRSGSRSGSARRNGGPDSAADHAAPVADASEELDLDAIIRQRERDEALAVGRDYAKRPTSYKTSLSTQMVVGTARKRSRTPPPVHRSSRHSRTSRRSPSPEVKRKKKPSKEHMEKMERLRQQYGDASAKKKDGD